MVKVGEIFEYLNRLAPVSLKMDFDNVGLLVGDASERVSKCLVSLDITDEVIDEAACFGADLIVSHHPIIFGAVKSVTADDLVGRKIIALIRNNISAICMHTNLDIAGGGVNDVLMAALSAQPQRWLEPCGTDENGNAVGCGRIGELESPMQFESFLKLCKTALKANGLRYHYAGRPVKKLAVMGGSGGSSLMDAVNAGCDTYVTSDIKYNSFLDAKELGINLIDVDHFCTENVIVPVLADKLIAEVPDVEFAVSSVHAQTARFF